MCKNFVCLKPHMRLPTHNQFKGEGGKRDDQRGEGKERRPKGGGES